MCGVSGAFGRNNRFLDLDSHLVSLRSRGPDDSKALRSELIQLGATRLAMTDPLARSNQPMSIGGQTLVFNGEIYNYKKIRADLKAEFGVEFVTDSDTEVLLYTLKLRGAEGLRALEGMWAFAFYDPAEKRLLISRDSLGKKPLYYLLSEDTVYWSSSPFLGKYLSNKFKTKVNREAIYQYLSLGYVLDPVSPIAEVKAVCPGETISFVLSQDGNMSATTTKSKTDFKRDFFGEVESIDLRESLKNAVLERVSGHSQVAISLSGGVDSSLIASLARNNVGVVCFSAYFQDADKERYNVDFNYAHRFAKYLGTDFVKVKVAVSENLDSKLRDYVKAVESPNANPTGLSMMEIYREIRAMGLRLALTGDGADEIFGGYQRYLSIISTFPLRFIRPGLDKMLKESHLNGSTWSRLLFAGVLATTKGHSWVNWLRNHEILSTQKVVSMFREQELFIEGTSTLRHIEEALEHLESTDNDINVQKRFMNRDLEVWLSQESNRRLDSISMNFSVEARSPFQSREIIQIANAIYLKRGIGIGDKKVLRDIFPPDEVRMIRLDKSGFISPVGSWLRKNPKVVTNGLEYLCDSGLFNNSVWGARDFAFSKDHLRIRQLWSLCVLGYWLNEHF